MIVPLSDTRLVKLIVVPFPIEGIVPTNIIVFEFVTATDVAITSCPFTLKCAVNVPVDVTGSEIVTIKPTLSAPFLVLLFLLHQDYL